jgi:hypothetical protein
MWDLSHDVKKRLAVLAIDLQAKPSAVETPINSRSHAYSKQIKKFGPNAFRSLKTLFGHSEKRSDGFQQVEMIIINNF